MRHAAIPLASLALAAALVGPALVAPAASPLLVSRVAAAGRSEAPPQPGPTEEYLEAQAHAHDHLSLQPPRPVTVALHPRPFVALVGSSAGSRRTEAAIGLTAGPSREIYGFLPYWELADPDLTLDYSVLSTIAYFGLTARATGDLEQTGSNGAPEAGWTGWQSGNLTAIIDAAHAQGTRVALTVERFAWDTAGTAATTALLSSPTARATLVGQIVAQVLARGVDGVNLDVEPVPAGQSANFDALVQALRNALNAARPGLELVVDVTGDIGNYDVTALTAPGAADALFIMGYDYRRAGAAQAGSIAPLVSPTYDTDLTRTLQAYLSLTTPDHLLLGLPYYGRAWSTISNQPNASTLPQNDQNGYSVAAPYTAAADLAATNGLQWDGTETSAWTTYQRQFCATCPNVWRELYFDNAQSLAAKYQLVLAAGLRGTGIWALGYDGTKPELTQLMHQVFGAVAPLPPTGSLAVTADNVGGNPPNAFSPNGDGVADTATLSWWISAPATGSVAIRAGSTTLWSAAVTGSSGSVTWNGTNGAGTAVPDGTYAVVLTAQDVNGTALTLTASVVVNRVVGFLVASPNRFFPQDGDARRRSAAISYRMATAGNSTLRILNGAGAVVRTAWYARRTPAGTYAWIWDGRDSRGAMVPQGDYTIQVVATGPAGRAFLTKPLTAAAYMVRTTLTGAAPALSYLVDAWSSEPLRRAPAITLAIGGQTLAGRVVDLGGGHYQTTFSGLALAGSGTLTIAGVDAVGDSDRYSIDVSFGDAAPTPAGTPPPAPSPAPSPAPAPTAGSSPAPSSSPTPNSSPAGYPTTIMAMCPSIWVRRSPSTAAPAVATIGAGATAVASGAVLGSAYTSSCYHVGNYRWWYEITALNGQPLANPLYVATAFWNKP